MQSTRQESHLAAGLHPDVNREFHLPANEPRPGLSRNTIYLIDDDLSVLETLSPLLSAIGENVVCFRSAADYSEYGKPGEPSCLIIDMQLPGKSSVVPQRQINREMGPAVIFTTDRSDVPGTVLAMKAGAVQVLTKPIDPSALMEAVAEAVAQDRKQRLRNAELLKLQGRFSLLTPRERQVVPLIVSGLLNKQAASVLGISEVTLQIHRSQVMRKMMAGSVAELVRMAVRLRISCWEGRVDNLNHGNNPPVNARSESRRPETFVGCLPAADGHLERPTIYSAHRNMR